MKKYIAVFLFMIIPLTVFSQNNPMVAIVPFNPIGVSENEALVITNLFETALVKTGSFDVIEQNQIEEIMDAQAYTLTGCTDESCAIEVGKLLAAEQIILGDLSSIGGKFILNVKIIDVEKGKNINADSVDASNMGEMTETVELLAYKLAGLTYSSGGGSVQIAEAFGEVLIETSPSGADIYVNGVKKGISPDLISRIPLGEIKIEARKGNLYAVKDINVTENTSQIKLSLKEQYGNLFIKSSDRNVRVLLDGSLLGDLETGFFDKLSIGNHLLELEGHNVYWSKTVSIEAGESTRVEAYPRGFGHLEYSLPEKSEAVITGTDLRRVVRGEGTLQLFTGKYNLVIESEIYEEYSDQFSISRGRTISFSPELTFTQEYRDRLAKEQRDSLYKSLSGETVEIKKIILPEYRISDNDMSRLDKLGQRLSESDFSDLLSTWVEINSEAMERKKLQDELEQYAVQKEVLDTQVMSLEKSQKGHSVNGWISAGIGGGAAVLSITSFVLSWINYQEYLDAGSEEWQVLKDSYQTWDMIGYVSAGAAALGGGLTPVFWLTGPKDDDISGSEAKLAYINSEIERLEKALQ